LSEPINIQLREATAEDVPFIRATWLRSFGNSQVAHTLGDRFLTVWGKLVDDLLPICALTIAYSPEEPKYIIGWLACEQLEGLIHYVYTRGPLQRYGVASELLAGMRLDEWTITHGTVDSLKVCRHWQSRGHPVPMYRPIEGIDAGAFSERDSDSDQTRSGASTKGSHDGVVHHG
jgi:hypothetical protein